MIKYVSPSKLKQYRLCPFSTTLEFKSSPQADFGTAVHAGIVDHFKGKDFLSSYRSEAGKLGVNPNEEENALKCFEFAKEQDIDPDTILTMESEDQPLKPWGKHCFEVPLTDVFGLLGSMDMVYVNDKGELVIIDWKTGLTKEEDDLQLAIYALAALKLYPGFDTIVTRFVYLKQNCTQTSIFTSEKLARAFEYIAPLAEAYVKARAENKLPRQANKYCCYCSAKDSCPVYKNMVEAEPYKPSYYDIEAKIENLSKLMEAKERACAIAKAAGEINACLEAKIKDLIEQAGGKMRIDGRTFEVKESTSRYEYNLPTIFQATQELIGRPPYEICSFSSTKLAELKKGLDKEQKKTLQAIVDCNKTVGKTTKKLVVNIDSEPILIDDNPND